LRKIAGVQASARSLGGFGRRGGGRPLEFVIQTSGTYEDLQEYGDRMVAALPNFLQFGYMPHPADIKSQGIPNWVVVLCALTMAAGTAAGG